MLNNVRSMNKIAQCTHFSLSLLQLNFRLAKPSLYGSIFSCALHSSFVFVYKQLEKKRFFEARWFLFELSALLQEKTSAHKGRSSIQHIKLVASSDEMLTRRQAGYWVLVSRHLWVRTSTFLEIHKVVQFRLHFNHNFWFIFMRIHIFRKCIACSMVMIYHADGWSIDKNEQPLLNKKVCKFKR